MINTKRNTQDKDECKNQKAKLRTEFPALTDEDVNYDFEKKNEMVEKLSAKLGKTQPELHGILKR